MKISTIFVAFLENTNFTTLTFLKTDSSANFFVMVLLFIDVCNTVNVVCKLKIVSVMHRGVIYFLSGRLIDQI